MWRFFRKRKALRAYRTRLFQHLRLTYGRRLYYSTEEVKTSIGYLRIPDEFSCFALGMFCDQPTFDAYHAAAGESCDYGAMRAEVFAHVAGVVSYGDFIDAGCTPDGSHVDMGGHHGHHDIGGHHDGGVFDGGHFDGSSFDGGGFDGGSSSSD
jgi:uncharacterized protein DUF6559